MNNNIIQIKDEENDSQLNSGSSKVDTTLRSIREAESAMGPGRNVMVLACHWRYFAAEDLEGLQKLGSCINYRMVEIPCSGQVQSTWITTALESGAEAVLVMGGHPDTCHFAKCMKCGDLHDKESSQGAEFDPARISVDWSEGDRSSRFSGTVEKFISTLGSHEEPAK
jgi:F420-non-reducing hydrogenase iron-sulfur subunit